MLGTHGLEENESIGRCLCENRVKRGYARKVRLNSATVRSHASFAAPGSKRGVVSLLKPCWVPGY